MEGKQLSFGSFGGDWTEKKLNILSEYLCAYNKALSKQIFRRIYIDAFAGTGYRQQKQAQLHIPSLFAEEHEETSQKFLKGSAKRALEATPPFDEYIFVEQDERKVAELERLRSEHPNRTVRIAQADANSFVQTYCASADWRATRAVLFLDPFATEVEWSTIAAVARTKAIDMWLLFPLMAVHRLIAHDPAKACRKPLDRIFGTEEWFERFYRAERTRGIFGQDIEAVKRACDTTAIGDFFLERMRGIFAGVAENPKLLDSGRGVPLFYLFFAAANPRGARVAIRIASHLLERM